MARRTKTEYVIGPDLDLDEEEFILKDGRRLTNELGLEVRVADEPLTCAVRGAGAAAASGLLDEAGYE